MQFSTAAQMPGSESTPVEGEWIEKRVSGGEGKERNNDIQVASTYDSLCSVVTRYMLPMQTLGDPISYLYHNA